jgi:glycosyltransferase involved in cell wall biosynthesis
MKKVSVIIPAYNHGHLIGDAISSVFESDYQNFEVIVIDDGSTDNTKQVVSSFESVFYQHQQNFGAHHAINQGISLATGDLIAILNDDDMFSNGHLTQAVSNLETYGNSFFIGKAEVFGQGHKLHLLKEHILSSTKAVEDYGWILSLFKINWSISTSSFVFNRELFRKLGGFHGFSLCHDLDFLLRALLIERASVGVSDYPTWYYRCHETNSGSSINANKQASEIIYSLCRVLDPIMNEISSDHLLRLIGHGLSPNIKLFAASEKPWLKEFNLTIDNSIAEWAALCKSSNLDLLL